MKKILFVLISLIVVQFAMADSKQSLIEVGNGYYVNGEFSKAIESYEQVLLTGYEAAQLYFNLGNAYYKNGQIPSAILNYERASLLAPLDEDIAFNLELANTHVVDQLDAIPEFFLSKWIGQLISLYTTDSWAYGSLIAFVVFLALLLIFMYAQISILKRLAFYGAIFSILISIFSLYASSEQKSRIADSHSAIVFSPSITVKSSPDNSGTDLFLLHEGTKVSLKDSVGNWMNIELSDGNEGWIEKKHLEII